MLNFLIAAAGLMLLDEEGTRVNNTIGAALFGVGLSRAIDDFKES